MKKLIVLGIALVMLSCASTDKAERPENKIAVAKPDSEQKLVEVTIKANIGKKSEKNRQRDKTTELVNKAVEVQNKGIYNGTPIYASATTTILGCPAMHISSYDTEDPVEVGKQTTYIIEARNEGSAECTNVSLVNTIDNKLEFMGANAPVDYKIEGNKIIFSAYPILYPGDKVRYEVVCRTLMAGSIKNTALLRFDQFEMPIVDEEGTSAYGMQK